MLNSNGRNLLEVLISHPSRHLGEVHRSPRLGSKHLNRLRGEVRHNLLLGNNSRDLYRLNRLYLVNGSKRHHSSSSSSQIRTATRTRRHRLPSSSSSMISGTPRQLLHRITHPAHTPNSLLPLILRHNLHPLILPNKIIRLNRDINP
jgi:hypothetical protein